MGLLWVLLVVFLAVFAALGIAGAVLQKKAEKEGRIPSKEDDETLPKNKEE